MRRSLRYLALLLLLHCPVLVLQAEKVADLPAPTGYVSDFANVLSPAAQQRVESICTQLDRQTGAQIAVVTVKTLDNDQTIEEFTVDLEEKWKVGKKGKDNGLIMVIVLNPKKIRTEVGYGLEGALNDAKVGDIQRTMVPYLHAGDYDSAIPLGVQAYARVIAADAGVTLTTPTEPTYSRPPPAQPQGFGIGQLILGIGFVVLILIMLVTGNGGWIWVILSMFLNGGGGGGRRGGGFGGGGGDGGGFGGFGGGSSGGGGASSDY